MGDLPFAAASYGIEVITPAAIDRPDASSPLSRSSDGADGLCEYLEDRDPFALLEPQDISSIDEASVCPESEDFSL